MDTVTATNGEPQPRAGSPDLNEVAAQHPVARKRYRQAQHQAHHEASIRAIADELGRPLNEIAALYQTELGLLAAHATVVDFLPIFITKRLRLRYAAPA